MSRSAFRQSQSLAMRLRAAKRALAGVARVGGLVLQQHVVGAALYDGGGGHQRELRLVLELGNGERTTVAHGALHLVQGGLHAVCQRTGVRHIAVHALLKAQFGGAAQVIALPVAGTVGAIPKRNTTLSRRPSNN